MLLTKTLIKFNNLLVKIPKQTKEFGTWLKTDGVIKNPKKINLIFKYLIF